MKHTPRPSGAPGSAGPVAAIDVGSNAIRFLVAEPLGRTGWSVIDSARIPIRLGTSVFRTGELDAARIDEAVAAFAGFRLRMDAAGAERYRAVATSAVRDSRNGAELVDRVRTESAIHLEPISGEEEARLVWRAIRSGRVLDDRPRILVDLGGGSIEISLVAGDRLVSTESYRLGAVRLLAQLGANGVRDAGAVRRLLDDHEGVTRMAASAPDWRATGMIATGGNIQALADMARAPLDDRGFRVLPRQRLEALIAEIAPLSAAERAARWSLRPDRADVVLPAAIVYERVAEVANADRILVADVGVKEGVVLDLLGTP